MSVHPSSPPVHEIDPVWSKMCNEARDILSSEPELGPLIYAAVLNRASFEDALTYRLAHVLSSAELNEALLRDTFRALHQDDPTLGQAARADCVAVLDRDPACHRILQPLLFFKGFLAVQAHRVSHALWGQGRHNFAYLLQMRVSELFSIDIHPAAQIGRGIMIDHAHAIVIGETARVGDNVSLLHGVTLGGTGKSDGIRHPKIEDGVLLGAGAKVLGNITIGHCSRVAAGSVVLSDVPPCKTVAGVPARVVGEAGCDQPSLSMDQVLGG